MEGYRPFLQRAGLGREIVPFLFRLNIQHMLEQRQVSFINFVVRTLPEQLQNCAAFTDHGGHSFSDSSFSAKRYRSIRSGSSKNRRVRQ